MSEPTQMSEPPHWGRITDELNRLLGNLEDVRFDSELCEKLMEGVRSGRYSREANVLPHPARIANPEDVSWLGEFSEEQLSHYRTLGTQALAAGRVASVVLNGGMATRFGGVVKGTVEVLGTRSFLEIKRSQALARGNCPFVLMNSAATQIATAQFLADRDIEAGVESFLQSVSLRLTPTGNLFRDAQGHLSTYSPGHGDFVRRIRHSGMLDHLAERGVDTLLLSNVDNLCADPAPEVIGFHLAAEKPLTVELARTLPGDAGGAPAWVDGNLQIVEGFRFPAGTDFAALPFISTNTFLMSAEILRKDYDLTWFYVEKQVDGQRVIQMEQLVGELSAFVPTAYLASERESSSCRFYPVKSRDDLSRLREDSALEARILESCLPAR